MVYGVPGAVHPHASHGHGPSPAAAAAADATMLYAVATADGIGMHTAALTPLGGQHGARLSRWSVSMSVIGVFSSFLEY